ncbi:U3 small nnucleolar ribonucleoprotein Mpp10 family protein [Babesia bovis T2Bo]|uniref:U3 small nucleolar ribonucleoprotein protein, putative n=1 Tax=Babesia bovis TaxID=5865 RepID=A7AVA4_BABBO|nr:U3 small nnucleolar ribonucleoprotein Mpp10 family protein [Babesia bovis T2Bo]EDO05730.1 U3 small nnucleolar ribonucleoprotein Mpp10 family protein [Babesia bovis T2Bo]|eukprot:XP_001609298.1 U3 small nucleolar ribonucleoprotein protein [Babesia bovis T2Bo]
MEKSNSEIPDSTDACVSPSELLQRPWTLFDNTKQCESMLRDKLLEFFKGVVLLKRRRIRIADEVGKKRSTRSAAIKRALALAKADSKRVYNSASTLGVNDLWTYLESELSGDIKLLTEKLEKVLQTQPRGILKSGRGDLQQQGNRNSHISVDDSPLERGMEDVSSSSESMGESDTEEEDYDDDQSDEESEPGWETASAEDEIDGSKDVGTSDESDYESPDDGLDDTSMDKRDKATKDRFFKMEEMEEFANGEIEDEDDFNYFESLGEESDDSKPAVDMMYDDFFKEPSEDGDEAEALHCSRDLEGLDADEREMELLLQRVEEDGESEDEYSDRDESELVDFDHNIDPERERQMDDVDDDDDQISQVEKDLIAEKHWSLMGEASARKRARNSLLDLDLELPQNSAFIHAEAAGEMDGVVEDDTMGLEENQDVPIEIIIQQRIKAEVFDNIERKIAPEDQLEAIERLKQKRNKMNQGAVEIDFNKSKMGLGDVYAQRYQEMFMATDKLDAHKQKLAEDFGKIMFKLDSLCNYHIVPKRVSEAEKNKNVASITVEAPINVVPASRHNDVTDISEGNKLSRTAKKRKFTNKIKALLKSGKATVEDIKRMKQKMVERNRQKIEDMRSVKATGQTKERGAREQKPSGRVKIAELMNRRK